MTEEIDTLNRCAVGLQGDQVVILLPKPMTFDEALVCAAYIVAAAEPFASLKFKDALRAVQAT